MPPPVSNVVPFIEQPPSASDGLAAEQARCGDGSVCQQTRLPLPSSTPQQSDPSMAQDQSLAVAAAVAEQQQELLGRPTQVDNDRAVAVAVQQQDIAEDKNAERSRRDSAAAVGAAWRQAANAPDTGRSRGPRPARRRMASDNPFSLLPNEEPSLPSNSGPASK